MDEIVHIVKKDGMGTLFGHVGDKISKNRGKITLSFKGA